MSQSVLWGVLGIVAFSLVGFALLASAGLAQHIPPRWRWTVSVGLHVFQVLLLSWAVHKMLFAADGPVSSGQISSQIALALWAAGTALVAFLVIRGARRTNQTMGSGASE